MLVFCACEAPVVGGEVVGQFELDPRWRVRRLRAVASAEVGVESGRKGTVTVPHHYYASSPPPYCVVLAA